MGLMAQQETKGAKKIFVSRAVLKKDSVPSCFIHSSKGSAIASMKWPKFLGQTTIIQEHFLVGQGLSTHPADVGTRLPGIVHGKFLKKQTRIGAEHSQAGVLVEGTCFEQGVVCHGVAGLRYIQMQPQVVGVLANNAGKWSKPLGQAQKFAGIGGAN